MYFQYLLYWDSETKWFDVGLLNSIAIVTENASTYLFNMELFTNFLDQWWYKFDKKLICIVLLPYIPSIRRHIQPNLKDLDVTIAFWLLF